MFNLIDERPGYNILMDQATRSARGYYPFNPDAHYAYQESVHADVRRRIALIERNPEGECPCTELLETHRRECGCNATCNCGCLCGKRHVEWIYLTEIQKEIQRLTELEACEYDLVLEFGERLRIYEAQYETEPSESLRLLIGATRRQKENAERSYQKYRRELKTAELSASASEPDNLTGA